MLAVFAVISVILSALQVGLGTTELQGNRAFERFSYGFAVTSLVAVAVALAAVTFVWLVLFVYHLSMTRRNDRAVRHERLVARPA